MGAAHSTQTRPPRSKVSQLSILPVSETREVGASEIALGGSLATRKLTSAEGFEKGVRMIPIPVSPNCPDRLPHSSWSTESRLLNNHRLGDHRTLPLTLEFLTLLVRYALARGYVVEGAPLRL